MILDRNTISSVARILSSVSITRIQDKRAKSALLKDYLALRRVDKAVQGDRDEIARKFRDDWAEEMEAVEALRRAGKPIVGHDGYLSAEADANKAIAELFAGAEDVDLSPVDASVILSLQEDITLEQVALLQDAGIVE